MKNSFALTYILLTVAQMILSNYFHFTPFMMMTILPVMVFCIPTKIDSVRAMLIAFVTGLAVDFFAEGTLGLNAMSLVPVALLRRPVIGMFFGNEPFEQKESVTIRKYGFARVSLAIILMTALFLLVYVIADCAGTRPTWFIATKLGLSTMASYLASICVINLLAYEDRR
ncbi:MAG TPA: hypothetical protein DD383_05865 [Rikenellaceae bacterium]|nr:hypothetical protein [Rikenellaceae bacterium]HCQ72364.1 hypothetical protein [Rikenellaceae bacterium]